MQYSAPPCAAIRHFPSHTVSPSEHCPRIFSQLSVIVFRQVFKIMPFCLISVAQQSYVAKRGMGLFYESMADLTAQLKDRMLLKRISDNVIAARAQLTFDSHVPELTAFFRKTISRHRKDGKNT